MNDILSAEMIDLFFKRDIAQGYILVNGYSVKYAPRKMIFVYDVLYALITDQTYRRRLWLAYEVGKECNIECMRLLVSQGVRITWDWWLSIGCYQGVMEIVELALIGSTNLDMGMRRACEAGHLKIIELLIKRGATCWVQSMCLACQHKRPDVAVLLIQHGGPEVANHGLYFACQYQPSMVSLMIENGATNCIGCNNANHPELQNICN